LIQAPRCAVYDPDGIDQSIVENFSSSHFSFFDDGPRLSRRRTA
jgi:hypothetical protein